MPYSYTQVYGNFFQNITPALSLSTCALRPAGRHPRPTHAPHPPTSPPFNQSLPFPPAPPVYHRRPGQLLLLPHEVLVDVVVREGLPRDELRVVQQRRVQQRSLRPHHTRGPSLTTPHFLEGSMGVKWRGGLSRRQDGGDVCGQFRRGQF